MKTYFQRFTMEHYLATNVTDIPLFPPGRLRHSHPIHVQLNPHIYKYELLNRTRHFFILHLNWENLRDVSEQSVNMTCTFSIKDYGKAPNRTHLLAFSSINDLSLPLQWRRARLCRIASPVTSIQVEL